MVRQFGCKVQKDKAEEEKGGREKERRNGRPLPHASLMTTSTHMFQYLQGRYWMAEKHIFSRQVVFFLGRDILRRVQLESIDINDTMYLQCIFLTSLPSSSPSFPMFVWYTIYVCVQQHLH